MSYASQTDIDARYPGELDQAGPRDESGELDEAAINMACSYASDVVDRYLRAIGWTVPLVTYPKWITDITVDLALYQATPTVLASQAEFSDRKRRHELALSYLDDIVKGTVIPPIPSGTTANVIQIYISGNERQFGRGAL